MPKSVQTTSQQHSSFTATTGGEYEYTHLVSYYADEEVTDEEGNVILDEEGNPITEKVLITEQVTESKTLVAGESWMFTEMFGTSELISIERVDK